jgi:hypothetical protein
MDLTTYTSSAFAQYYLSLNMETSATRKLDDRVVSSQDVRDATLPFQTFKTRGPDGDMVSLIPGNGRYKRRSRGSSFSKCLRRLASACVEKLPWRRRTSSNTSKILSGLGSEPNSGKEMVAPSAGERNDSVDGKLGRWRWPKDETALSHNAGLCRYDPLDPVDTSSRASNESRRALLHGLDHEFVDSATKLSSSEMMALQICL